MIFSSLFKTKPNWQHKESTVRITAINNELSPDNSEQLQILSDLIKRDNSDLVRRAALIKVASFDCYLEASLENSLEKTKQFAAKQLHEILATENTLVLSTDEKHRILEKHAEQSVLPTPLLEAWLIHEQDSSLIIALYQLINVNKTSSHFLFNTFSQKQNVELQTSILNQVTDVKLLEKLNKKACDKTITQLIEEKLSRIQVAIEKPQKLTKQLQLVLAKLQALKDVNDYGVYKQRKSKLFQEWQALESDMSVFTAEEATEFSEKYQRIMDHLEKLFVAKAENYQQQIIADKLAHDKQQDKKDFTQQLNQISQSLTTAVFSNKTLDENTFKEPLFVLKKEIEASVLNAQEQKIFFNQVKELLERLSKIPEIAESVSQATHLISKVSQLNLPKSLSELNDRQQTYNDWLKAWRLIEVKTAGILPESITQAQKQIVSTWQSGLKTLQSEQKELFFQHKRKLQDIKRLLNNGKYKVCFGLFKGVKESYNNLSASQQQQLQRDYDTVSEKMAELSDWEHYIATPRKQELLLAIQELVETPLDNPNEQATKVKTYRNTWNSLGHADEDLDKQLNEQFNALCEQAFAPCRLFYAEQDKLRAQHLIQRQNILVQAQKIEQELSSTLSSDTQEVVDYKSLEGRLNNLQQQWQSAGEVDRNQYKKLQGQFKNITVPIKDAIHVFQQANATEKQLLISKVQELLTSDDVFSAIESAKTLQQSWRKIGFAGNHQENQLWQKFRQVNDQLFARRQELKTVQEAEQSSQQVVFEQQLSGIELSFDGLSSDKDASAQTVKQQAIVFLEQVVSNKPVIKVIASRVERLIKKIDHVIAEQETIKQKQSWTSLFELLVLQANEDNDLTPLPELAQFQQLTSFWQKRVQDQIKLTHQVVKQNRHDKTLEIEILGQAESPKDLASQRLKVQVQLMQDQMLSGAAIDLNKLLVEWLMLGKLSENDLPLINRLQAIYC